MDLSVLSPEEIEHLKVAMSEYESTKPNQMVGEHADIEEDRAFLEPIILALELLAKANEEMSEKICHLEKVVMDDIIGGVKNLYDSNMRETSIGELKSKYSELFEPLVPAWKSMTESEDDIYDKLYDIVNELKGQEGYTDEFGDGEIRGMAGKLKEKIDAIKGPGKPAQANMDTPQIEIEAHGDPEKLASMLERIKAEKSRSKGESIF